MSVKGEWRQRAFLGGTFSHKRMLKPVVPFMFHSLYSWQSKIVITWIYISISTSYMIPRHPLVLNQCIYILPVLFSLYHKVSYNYENYTVFQPLCKFICEKNTFINVCEYRVSMKTRWCCDWNLFLGNRLHCSHPWSSVSCSHCLKWHIAGMCELQKAKP